jgi:hypothetical protein
MTVGTVATTQYDRVSWDTFTSRFLRNWEQSQHVSLIGPTGCGKTKLLTQILSRRKYIVFFGTKVYDKTYNEIQRQGFHRISSWDESRAHMNKVMLWPRIHSGTSLREIYDIQRRAFVPALDQIFHERGWTLVNDELHYMCHQLRLEPEVAMYHHQGRSSHLTNVNGFQRPAHVPLVVYGSSAHAFLWPTTQQDTDAKRLSDFVPDSRELITNLNRLERYEFVYVNTVDRNALPVRTKVEV